MPGKFHGQRSLAGYSPRGSQKVEEEEDLLTKAKNLKTKFDEKAKALKAKYPDKIKEYRGLGAIYGIELTKPGAPVSAYCLTKNVLCNCTHNVVLRFLPSALLTDEELTLAFKVIDEAISNL